MTRPAPAIGMAEIKMALYIDIHLQMMVQLTSVEAVMDRMVSEQSPNMP
jgi:hypothetical protein